MSTNKIKIIKKNYWLIEDIWLHLRQILVWNSVPLNRILFSSCLNFFIGKEVEISSLSAMPEILYTHLRQMISDNKPVGAQNSKYSTLICNFLGHLSIERELSRVISMQIHNNIKNKHLTSWYIAHLIGMKTFPFQSMLPESQDAILQADCRKMWHVTSLSVATGISWTVLPIVSMGKPKTSSVIRSVEGSPWRLTIRTVPVQQISRLSAKGDLKSCFRWGQAGQTSSAQPAWELIRSWWAAYCI